MENGWTDLKDKERRERKDEWVETAESLGFCLNNQILLFMWSKLLHIATGHVQKLNDCKEREWQANGLTQECNGALRKALWMDVYVVYLVTFEPSLWHIIELFFFKKKKGGGQWPCPNYREMMRHNRDL